MLKPGYFGVLMPEEVVLTLQVSFSMLYLKETFFNKVALSSFEIGVALKIYGKKSKWMQKLANFKSF